MDELEPLAAFLRTAAGADDALGWHVGVLSVRASRLICATLGCTPLFLETAMVVVVVLGRVDGVVSW